MSAGSGSQVEHGSTFSEYLASVKAFPVEIGTCVTQQSFAPRTVNHIARREG
jgi:hypothetical protein